MDNCVSCQWKAQVTMCQLSMESTGYKMRGWMKIGFVLGGLYALLRCALNDTSHVL